MVDSTYSFWWATISIRLSRHGVSRSKFAFRQNFLLIKYLIGFDDFDVIRCPPVTLRIHRPKAPLDIAIVSSVNELIIYLLSLDSIKLEISINPVPVFSNVISAGEKAILLNLVDTYPQVFTPVHAPKILLRTLKMAADTRGIYNGRCITLSERWEFPPRKFAKYHCFLQLLALTILFPVSFTLETECPNYLKHPDLDSNTILRAMFCHVHPQRPHAPVTFFFQALSHLRGRARHHVGCLFGNCPAGLVVPGGTGREWSCGEIYVPPVVMLGWGWGSDRLCWNVSVGLMGELAFLGTCTLQWEVGPLVIHDRNKVDRDESPVTP